MAAANIEVRGRSKRRREEEEEEGTEEDGIRKQILKVDNLDPKVKQGQLSTYITAEFRRHIVAARIAREEATGKSKGYGFIRFDSSSIAERCLAMCRRRNKPFQLSWADDLRDVPDDILQAPQEPRKLPPTSSMTELPKLYDNWPSNLRDGNRTIRFDNLEPWVDVEDVQLFIPSPYWEQIHSRLLKRNGETLESEGYCFIQFASYAVAACFLAEYNGRQIPGTNMTFQLSWAPFRMYIDKRPDEEEMDDSNGKKKKDICLAPTVSRLVLGPPPHTDKDRSEDTIFIGAVDPNFKEDEVLQIFSKFGPLACVLINTSRGCGLVQFKAKEAAQCAMQEVRKLVHKNEIGFIGWARSDDMQGKTIIFFNPVLSGLSSAFHSSRWGGQGNPNQSSSPCTLGAQGNFKLPLSGRMGPPPRRRPVRYVCAYDSSGISRVFVIEGPPPLPQHLLYPMQTAGTPMASRVDASCSAEPQEKTVDVDR